MRLGWTNRFGLFISNSETMGLSHEVTLKETSKGIRKRAKERDRKRETRNGEVMRERSRGGRRKEREAGEGEGMREKQVKDEE